MAIDPANRTEQVQINRIIELTLLAHGVGFGVGELVGVETPAFDNFAHHMDPAIPYTPRWSRTHVSWHSKMPARAPTSQSAAGQRLRTR
jgi:hypothetical protein